MYYHFEQHDSDGNDNSITDIMIEADSKEEAEVIIEKEMKVNGFVDDNSDTDMMSFQKDIDTCDSASNDFCDDDCESCEYHNFYTYFKTFYYQGEYEKLSDFKRSNYHGYDEILK
jgi:hypothetical protein